MKKWFVGIVKRPNAGGTLYAPMDKDGRESGDTPSYSEDLVRKRVAELNGTPNLVILVRVDRVYGKLVLYPVNDQAKLLAEICGTATLTNKALALAERMGFDIVQEQGSLTMARRAG